MPYTKPTLADLKVSLADRHDSGTLPTDSATLSKWTRLFNRGVNYCINKLKITKSTSLTTSSGTIALPDDFISIVDVVNASNQYLIQLAPQDSEGATSGDLVFWITGDFASGFYLNTTNDETYTVYYSYRAVPMSSDSDTCPFPDEEAVVAYAYGQLRKSESDPFEDSTNALAECDARLKEIEGDFSNNEKPLRFSVQSFGGTSKDIRDILSW